jgi:hypothetical protein
VSTASLATHSERLLEVRRDFTLYADRIVVRARWFFTRRFEHVVQLTALTGEVHFVRQVRRQIRRY